MERLRHIREQVGYSQQELADESRVSQHTISEIELGRRKPQGRTLRKLAHVLGVEVRDFFEEPTSPLGQAPPESRLGGAERRTARDYQVGEAEAYFVPLEEGEEEDKVEIRFYYYQVLEGDEPILKAMRKASPEEAAAIREEFERPRG